MTDSIFNADLADQSCQNSAPAILTRPTGGSDARWEEHVDAVADGLHPEVGGALEFERRNSFVNQFVLRMVPRPKKTRSAALKADGGLEHFKTSGDPCSFTAGLPCRNIRARLPGIAFSTRSVCCDFRRLVRGKVRARGRGHVKAKVAFNQGGGMNSLPVASGGTNDSGTIPADSATPERPPRLLSTETKRGAGR